MECLSMFAQSRAVAPPGRRLRALMSSGGMPVESLRRSAACWSAFVMCRALTGCWVPSFAWYVQIGVLFGTASEFTQTRVTSCGLASPSGAARQLG